MRRIPNTEKIRQALRDRIPWSVEESYLYNGTVDLVNAYERLLEREAAWKTLVRHLYDSGGAPPECGQHGLWVALFDEVTRVRTDLTTDWRGEGFPGNWKPGDTWNGNQIKEGS